MCTYMYIGLCACVYEYMYMVVHMGIHVHRPTCMSVHTSACAQACTDMCTSVCMEFIAEVREVSADMAAPGILLYRLGEGREHYNRLLSRLGAGESRKKSFTRPGQQEAPHPASSIARAVAAGWAARVVFADTYLPDLLH